MKRRGRGRAHVCVRVKPADQADQPANFNALSPQPSAARAPPATCAGRSAAAAYCAARRFPACSIGGMKSDTAVPSGSRNWNVLLPHGIVFNSCTSVTLSFRR
jgi:hypothetical protein